MEDTLEVEVVTPEKAVLKTTAKTVILPGILGELGILPGHLPMMTGIGTGTLTIQSVNGDRTFFIDGGFAEVLPNKVSVLTDYCDGVDEIDVAHAQQELEMAEKALKEAEEKSRTEVVEEEVFQRHQDTLRKARMKLVMKGKLQD